MRRPDSLKFCFVRGKISCLDFPLIVKSNVVCRSTQRAFPEKQLLPPVLLQINPVRVDSIQCPIHDISGAQADYL